MIDRLVAHALYCPLANGEFRSFFFLTEFLATGSESTTLFLVNQELTKCWVHRLLGGGRTVSRQHWKTSPRWSPTHHFAIWTVSARSDSKKNQRHDTFSLSEAKFLVPHLWYRRPERGSPRSLLLRQFVDRSRLEIFHNRLSDSCTSGSAAEYSLFLRWCLPRSSASGIFRRQR